MQEHHEFGKHVCPERLPAQREFRGTQVELVILDLNTEQLAEAAR